MEKLGKNIWERGHPFIKNATTNPWHPRHCTWNCHLTSNFRNVRKHHAHPPKFHQTFTMGIIVPTYLIVIHSTFTATLLVPWMWERQISSNEKRPVIMHGEGSIHIWYTYVILHKLYIIHIHHPTSSYFNPTCIIPSPSNYTLLLWWPMVPTVRNIVVRICSFPSRSPWHKATAWWLQHGVRFKIPDSWESKI